MKRRDFLRSMPAIATPFMLGGLPLNTLGRENFLTKLAAESTNDKVIVLIQLHGGNDGLNMLIPREQYSSYFDLRSNIALSDKGLRKIITLDGTLPKEKQIALHPDMTGVKSLYDEGRVAIVQSVGYDNLNMSHFRSRDIWYTGSDANQYVGSGWMGRYLDQAYPGYPQDYPSSANPDPLAIEIGRDVSLAFHNGKLPMSISINNPDQFKNLIDTVRNSQQPPDTLKETYYRYELDYIAQMEKKSDKYADRLATVYKQGSNTPSVNYSLQYPNNAPKRYLNNELASQLQLIAKLLSGGSKTKVFLARLSQFDTHDSQVDKIDKSTGSHAALLYHLSSAMRAFQDDLKGLGLEHRVLTTTFSEFGRRVKSNGSYGTDHGTAAPMLVFGSCVNPGVIGNAPDLTDLQDGNLKSQYDYRQVFTTMLKNWMGASEDAINNKVSFEKYNKPEMLLNLINTCDVTSNQRFINERFKIFNCYPNPAKLTTTINFYINTGADVKLTLLNTQGQVIKHIINKYYDQGEHTISVDLNGIKPGTYLYKIEAGILQSTKKLIVL